MSVITINCEEMMKVSYLQGIAWYSSEHLTCSAALHLSHIEVAFFPHQLQHHCLISGMVCGGRGWLSPSKREQAFGSLRTPQTFVGVPKTFAVSPEIRTSASCSRKASWSIISFSRAIRSSLQEATSRE